MIESGQLSKLVTIKGPDGRPRAVRIHRYGPIAFMESTTSAHLFDEDANRCLLLGTDESPEQTRRIVEAQAARALHGSGDRSDIIQRHHAAQRLLRRVSVTVPFAPALARAIPVHRQEARRAMPRIISMIRSIALLHQLQRIDGTPTHGDVIEATLQDYVVARKLLVVPMGRALGDGLPGAVAKFGHVLISEFGQQEFTSTDTLSIGTSVRSRSKANEYLGSLQDAGVVECVADASGPKPARWRCIGEIPMGGALWLPALDAVEANA
jgi:hypothetical protein